MKKPILLALPLLLAACAASGPVASFAPPPDQIERIEVGNDWPGLYAFCSHGSRVWYGYTRTGPSTQNGITLTLTSQPDPTCPQGK